MSAFVLSAARFQPICVIQISLQSVLPIDFHCLKELVNDRGMAAVRASGNNPVAQPPLYHSSCIHQMGKDVVQRCHQVLDFDAHAHSIETERTSK